jgi:hypothetical protein
MALMITEQIVALLIQERDRLNRAIEALQGPVKRRGRPPRTLLAESASSAPTEKKRGWTAAQKEAASARMKARWAKKRKAEKK